MKKVIQTLVLCGLLVGLQGMAFSQAAGPQSGNRPLGQGQQGRNPANMMRRMADMQKEILGQLNLTNDQKTKIKALDEKLAKDMREAWEKQRGQAPTAGAPAAGAPKGGQRGRGGPTREVMQNHRKELMKVLTPDQRKKYDELWKKKREEMAKERGRPRRDI
jgi:Spy/CpxP family protein refolding chaperone